MQSTAIAFNHPEWQDFLSANRAHIENGRVSDFGDPAAERTAAANGNIIADLSHYALLRAQGPEARDFLQGQLSNDLRTLDNSHAQLSSYCNPKGRMLAVLRLFQRGEDIYLALPVSIAEGILKRLRMFVMRAKVKLEEERSLVHFGISGPDVEPLLITALGQIPASSDESAFVNDVTIIRLAGPSPRFVIIAPFERARELWVSLAEKNTPVGTGPWAWLDIQAGVPVVLPETSEEFVPQMANLDLINGVSFKKGCYPGQEIVARMHYLGKLKQRMLRMHADTDSAPRPGEKLYAKSFGDQAAGTVVMAEPSPAGGSDILAVVQIEPARQNELHLSSTDGPHLAATPLPYSIPDMNIPG
ncbi:MAG: folate-binding protein YgfZ [Gammaproteobacteria bacterium]|nr:folate-binding protein YgfZ [Gammaproteobacteria bacterium]